MTRLLLSALLLLGFLSGRTARASAPAETAGNASQRLNSAAALYYQGRYEAARAELDSLLSAGPWKRRDSLMLYQYLGMSCARLGRDSAAVEGFGSLLALDSLFRFPKNEDPAVLAAFARAREKRAAPARESRPQVTPSLPETGPAPLPAPADSSAASGRPAPAALALRDTAAPAPLAPAATLPPAPAPGAPALGMGVAYGAIPFGAGWMMRSRVKRGAAMGAVQAAGLLLSAYASDMQSRRQRDRFGLEEGAELSSAEGWQWVQRISVSVALGTYLFSIFASVGE